MSYKFIELKRYLNDNSINFSSDIPDDTLIQGINSVEIADNHQITFYTNYKYLDALRSTKAKACFIKKDYINFLPNTCIPIIVNDPYLAFVCK